MNKRKAQDMDVHVRAIPEPRAAGQRTRRLERVVWRPRGMALQGARPVGAFQGAWLSSSPPAVQHDSCFLGIPRPLQIFPVSPSRCLLPFTGEISFPTCLWH